MSLWPVEKTGRRAGLGVPETEKGGENRRRDETVEAVHETAVTGNELARILDMEVALDPGFEQVAALRHRAGDEAEREHRPDRRIDVWP